jgi:hypothetical protein
MYRVCCEMVKIELKSEMKTSLTRVFGKSALDEQFFTQEAKNTG